MTEFLRRAFLDNGALKFVALLLAIAMFIVVRGDRDTTVSFYVPVAYTEAGERVLTSKPVDSIRVTVSGAWARLRRFDAGDIEPVKVDLGRFADGDFIFQPDMIDLPPGVRVTAINPPSLRLVFEERATKIVPIRADLTGDLARGYRVEKTTVEPDEVEVRGARSVVEALTEVRTRPIDLTGRAATFDTLAPLAEHEAHVTMASAVPVSVRVEIAESLGAVTLGTVPVRVRAAPGAPAAPANARTTPDRVKVTLRGPRNAVDQVERARVTAVVTWHAEDGRSGAGRQARVLVEGVPAGVAVEVEPREVVLRGRR